MPTRQPGTAASPSCPQARAELFSLRSAILCSVLFCSVFIAIVSMVLVPSASNDKNSLSILHQVPEGHVGAYWRGGALLKTLTDPGFHLKMPLITHFEPIQVTLKKYLIGEKMKNALQASCNYSASGIQIVNVYVIKPLIPDSIRQYFELMEIKRTKVMVAVETQKVAEKEAETRKKIAISEAEKNAQISKIQMEQKLMEKDSVMSNKDWWDWLNLIMEKILLPVFDLFL
ncbi:hypothetical protein F0562_033847 [Nyssa sinensis]|uniref:Band 7 domain-containing protein n=1 Tax=Nyssa sinensis TaxID=561372 RepID=A0A5J5AGJ6_9ASTE|nr:hypothetical protein F0562_033847 [Nyssa sinensis]